MADRGGRLIGEEIRTAKLTADDVRLMRRLRVDEGWSQRELARAFGVCRITVHRVLTRKSWAHVD